MTTSSALDEKSINIIAMSDMQIDTEHPDKFAEINSGIINYFNQNYIGPVNQNLDLVLIPGDLVKTGSNYTIGKITFLRQQRNYFLKYHFIPF